MTDDALEAFIHGDRPDCERVFHFSSTDSDKLMKALASSKKCKSHFSDFEDKQKFLVVKRCYYICQLRIEENMSKLRPEYKKQIGFCFIESGWPNARVVRAEDNTNSILVNNAFIPFLFGFWRRAVKKGGLNTSIDELSNTNREVWLSFERLNAIWTDTMLRDIEDPSLRYYLWECVRIGLEAVIDHEFGHIVRGHQQLASSLNPIIKEYEMNSEGLSEKEALLRQIIELDADTFAAHLAIWSFLKRGERSQHAHAEAPCNQYYRNIKHAYQTICLSLYVTFRIFGPYHDQIESMQTQRHPPLFIRFGRMYNTFTDFLNKVPDLAGKLDELQDLNLFEAAYCDITGVPFDTSLGKFWLTNQYQSYSTKLLGNLGRVFYKLNNPFLSRT